MPVDVEQDLILQHSTAIAMLQTATAGKLAALFDIDNSWIFDSGCGKDLVEIAKARLYMHMTQMAPPISFSTANGPAGASKTLPLVFVLRDVYHANPYLMEKTPSVLSMGLGCMHQGFAFIWLPNKIPCIITPKGIPVPLDIEGDVPCIKADGLWRKLGGDPTRISELCGVSLVSGVLQLTHHQYPAVPGSSSGGASSSSSGVHAAEGGGQPAEPKPGIVHGTGKGKAGMMKPVDLCMSKTKAGDSDSEGSTRSGTNSEHPSDLEGETEDDDDPVRRSLYAEAQTIDHKLNHKPSLPKHCSECLQAKMRRKRRYRHSFNRDPKKFGDIVTCDHVLMKDWFGIGGIDGYNDTLNVLDLATKCKHSFPTHGLDTFETFCALNQVKGKDRVQNVYCDNYGSLVKAAKQIGATCEPSQPGVHHSNAIIENCNGDILNGTRTLLLQAGIPACFWPYGSPYYCHIENIAQEPDGENRGGSAWRSRHGEDFPGKCIPLAAAFISFRPQPRE